MRIVCLLLIALNVACGRPEPHVNNALRAGYERYLRIAPTHGHLDDVVSIDFGSVPGDALGICIQGTDGIHGIKDPTRKIRIKHRADLSPILVETLVAHEMAHCLHDFKHDNSGVKLMNTKLYEDSDYWLIHLDDEIRNLF